MARNPQQLDLQLGFRLPMFVMRRVKKGSRLIKITCSRCNNHFWVDGKLFAHSSAYNTRPCPYCFKTSRIRNA